MKLTQPQKNLLALYKRSPKDNEGWTKVSKNLWFLVEKASSDLFEAEQTPSAETYGRMRLTNAGETLLEYVI